MKRIKTKNEKPISGIGVVQTGEKSFTIDLEYDDGKEKKFTFKFADLPETHPEGWMPKPGKEYWAKISANGQELQDIRPAKGTFELRSLGIAETSDGDYFIHLKEGTYGPYSQFIVNLEVQKGVNKGIVYPLYLPLTSGDKCRFEADDDGLFTVTGNPDKSKSVAMLFDFVEYAGLTDIDIEFPMDGDEPSEDLQDILDALNRPLRKQKRVFTGLVENGYVKSITELDEADEPEPEDAEPDEKPAKKSAKAEPEEEPEEKPKKRNKPNWD